MRCFKIKTFTNSWVFVFSYKSFSLCSWENKLSWKMSVCLFLLYNSTDLYFLEHISSKGCQWWLQDGKFSLQLPPSSKMQAATWLHGSACLKKTKGTSFFHVIIKKIKGKKNSRDISGSTMVIFSRCSFLQGNGSAQPWTGDPPRQKLQLRPDMNFVYASKSGHL